MVVFLDRFDSLLFVLPIVTFFSSCSIKSRLILLTLSRSGILLKYISLLGATGSIGTQTLDIIREHPNEFTLAAISVGRNIDLSSENHR